MMDMYWFMLVMMVIQTSWSATVRITPDEIAVEFGTDSVNFTCKIWLDMIEATHTNWRKWQKDGIHIPDNYPKYSVHGDPLATSTHYTQTLQIHSITDNDNGTYLCLLYSTSPPALSSSVASLLITYLDNPQPTCFNLTAIYSKTGHLSLIMYCSYPSGYPQTILQWTDNEGNELTNEPQVVQDGNIVLSATVNIKSDNNNQWFICRATKTPGATETKECVIGNIQVTMTTSSDNNIPMASTNKIINQSPMSTLKLITDQTETLIPPTFTSSANFSNNNLFSNSESTDKNIPTIIIVILAGFLLVYILIVSVEKWKNTNNEEIDLNSCQRGQWLEAANVAGATDIGNIIEDNQLYNIQLADIDQQSKNSKSFKTDTDDFDPSYATVNQTNAEEHERNEAKDDYLKSSDQLEDYSDQAVGFRNTGQQDHMTEHEYQTTILTPDIDSEFMATADMEFKRKPPVPAKKLNRSKTKNC